MIAKALDKDSYRREPCAMLLNTWFCDNLDYIDTKRFFAQGLPMKNPLDSIWGTIISGLLLTFVLYVFLNNFILAGV